MTSNILCNVNKSLGRNAESVYVRFMLCRKCFNLEQGHAQRCCVTLDVYRAFEYSHDVLVIDPELVGNEFMSVQYELNVTMAGACRAREILKFEKVRVHRE